MSLEALWTVVFSTCGDASQEQGNGVAVFETGRIFGGDSNFYYLGDYICTNGQIKARVKIARHGSNNDFEFELSGAYKGGESSLILDGTYLVNGKPTLVVVILTHIADLP